MARKAGSTVSALGIGTKVAEHDSKIDQAIDQAMADTTKPSAEQSRAEGSTPGIGLDRDLKLREPSEDDSSRSDEPGLIVGDIATASASLRAGLTDLTASAGSTEEEALETFLGSSRPSREELESTLPGHISGQGEEASQEEVRDQHNQARSGIMLSSWDYYWTDTSGDEHHTQVSADEDWVSVRNTNLETGDSTARHEVPGGGWIYEATDGETGSTVRNQNSFYTVTDKDGNITYQGSTPPEQEFTYTLPSTGSSSTKSSDENPADEQKQKDDSAEESSGSFWDAIVDFVTGLFGGKDENSTQGESDAKGGDVETTSDPDYIPPEVRKELIEAAGLDKIYRGSHDQDEIQLVEESATGWTATDGETAGAIPDLQDVLLGGDGMDNEGLHQGGGSSVGDAMNRTSQNGGATTWGEERSDAQGSGPEERNLQRDLKPKADTGEKAGTGDKDEASEESSSESAVEMVAIQDEKSQTLREHVEKDGGPKQDKAIDPDKLEKAHAKEVAHGAPSPASTDDLIAETEKPFEFLQETTRPDLDLQFSADIDLGGGETDEGADVEFSAPAVTFEHHPVLTQSVFDLDAA